MKKNQQFSKKEETAEIVKLDPIIIEKKELKYIINIETQGNKITFSINDTNQLPSVYYIRTLSLREINFFHEEFSSIASIYDFYSYLRSFWENKKLGLKKNDDDKLAIIIFISKEQTIEINLFQGPKELDLCLKEIWDKLFNLEEKIKENNIEINNLKNENKKLKNEIEALKGQNNERNKEIKITKIENQELKKKIEEQTKGIIILNDKFINYMNKSVIMKDYERNMVFTEIKARMKKRIKKIKKLYQATIDGSSAENFHYKCDNIPNTLVLVKSEGPRRFGGFTPIPWASEEKGIFLIDPELKTFVFSLDNKKIYHLKNSSKEAVYHDKNCGPCFGHGNDIGIIGDPIKDNNLYTYPESFEYKGDSQPLSENHGNKNIKALEYEVFQVVFL